MTKALRDRASEIVESDLGDFHSRRVRVVREGGALALTDELVLGLGQANELSGLRYRVDGGEFVAATLAAPKLESVGGADQGRKVYAWKLELPAGAKLVQVEVEQLDRNSTQRTLTWAIEPERR